MKTVLLVKTQNQDMSWEISHGKRVHCTLENTMNGPRSLAFISYKISKKKKVQGKE